MPVPDRAVRATLLASAPLNVVVAAVLAFPAGAPGRMLSLPADVPPLYAGLAAYLVALFGGMYLWLALQAELHRPMIALGAVGKAGAFAVAAGMAVSGHASLALVALASADLALAGLWTAWLRGEPASPDQPAEGG